MARLLAWFPLFLVLTGAAAAAQPPPPPVREPQRGQVLVPTAPSESAPEVRVAAGEATLLHFDAPLDRASVEVEARATRFRWVDVGDSFMVLEPSVDLGAEEKLVVRARYKDGASPAALTLVLVTRPRVVDKEVSVVRRAHTREALEARVAELESNFAAFKAQCAGGSLPQLAFSGMLESGIRVKPFVGQMATGYVGGLAAGQGSAYRNPLWAMVVLQVSNLPGHAPWMLSAARLTSLAGTSVKVRSVHMERPQLEAGGRALIAVMVDPPSTSEELFVLELVDASGGLHPIHDIKL